VTVSSLSRASVAPRGAITVHEDVADGLWDAFVARQPHASAYHRSGWCRLIGRAFGHEVRPLVAMRDGAVTGVLPVVIMRSRVFGKFAVSLPFVNAGGVLAEDDASEAELLDAATRVARGAGVEYLELRHTSRRFPGLFERTHKVAMTLALRESAEQQWQAVDRKVRNQVRKGEKSGLRVADGDIALVPDFYDVFAQNMRELGTPVFGRALFEEVMRTFPENSRVLCVYQGDRPIAASIVHWRGSWMEVPWASSLRELSALAPNMLLYWHMLQFAIARGCTQFEFGRCTPGEGTFHFKRQWGAEPSPLVWEYWTDGAPPRFSANQQSGPYSRASALWRKLPLGVTKVLGPRIVRGIPC
jgi:FemAB-related protein (PEP-CTERM system-associated)